MTLLDLTLPGTPPGATHHRKVIARRRRKASTLKPGQSAEYLTLRDSDALVAARGQIDALLMPYLGEIRATLGGPITCAVVLDLTFTWPWTRDHRKRDRALGRIPKTTRPDGLNMGKTTEDRLVALGILADDNLCTVNIVRRFYGDAPGIRIRIAPVEAVGIFYLDQSKEWTS